MRFERSTFRKSGALCVIDPSYTIQEISELGEKAKKPDSPTLQQDDRRIIMRRGRETESTLDSNEPNLHSQLPLSGKAQRYRFQGIALKRRLMDILACPIDKHYPLDLHVFEEREEIVEGLLVCSECGRWYPIMDEIPQLLPDDLREQRDELSWLSKWKENAPPQVFREGKPFNLQLSG